MTVTVIFVFYMVIMIAVTIVTIIVVILVVITIMISTVILIIRIIRIIKIIVILLMMIMNCGADGDLVILRHPECISYCAHFAFKVLFRCQVSQTVGLRRYYIILAWLYWCLRSYMSSVTHPKYHCSLQVVTAAMLLQTVTRQVHRPRYAFNCVFVLRGQPSWNRRHCLEHHA